MLGEVSEYTLSAIALKNKNTTFVVKRSKFITVNLNPNNVQQNILEKSSGKNMVHVVKMKYTILFTRIL